MKKISKKIILLVVLLFTIHISDAQMASGIPFLFSATTPSVAAVTTNNIILTTRTAAVQDEWDTIIAPGGFNFVFAGVNYTNFIVSSNGWMALTNSPPPFVPASVPTPLPNNSLSTNATGFPVIAPLWDDDNCGLVQWGVAANTLTVKWTLKWDKTNTTAYTTLTWVTLNGNSGVITMNYSTTPYAPTNPSASIGITGICTGDFYSVTPNVTVTSSTVDSVTENASVNAKPLNAKFTFTPYSPNDNCVNAQNMGTLNATCTYVTGSTFNATASGIGNCATLDVKDVWFAYYKPAGMTNMIFKTAPPVLPCGSVTGTSVEVYNVCGGVPLGCATTSVANPGYGEVTLVRSACVAETLYVRVTGDGDIPGKFHICAQDLSGLSPTNLIWTGANDTLFENSTNWDKCVIPPACGVNAEVALNSFSRMPTIHNNQSVGNLMIDTGASLRLQSQDTLYICGDFINNGTFIAEPGSIVIFIGTGNQNISGILTGINSFSNLVVNKTTGSVILNSNIDVSLNFITNNATSIFNINGKYMKVGANFINSTGNTTFTGISGSTVEFNGLNNVYFTNQNGSLALNRVTMNKSGKLYLTGPNSILNVDSVLTLTNGYIVTTPTLETNVKWGNLGALVSYSQNSYIDGRLRRKVVNLSSNDFPVGDSLVPNSVIGKGYELANITFTSSTIISDLLCTFNLWPGTVPVGPAASDFCGTYSTSYNNSPLYDNGYWSFVRTSAAFNGAYNVTLYNTGGTNSAGNTVWTVASAALAAPPLVAGSWFLSGTCFNPNTLAITKRILFNSPVLAGGASSFNQLYTTAQANFLPPSCTGSSITTNASCYGGTNGLAEISINLQNAGSTPFNYSINGGNMQVANTNPFNISGLSSGNYLVNYTTSSGCQNSINFTISQSTDSSINIHSSCSSYLWNGNIYTASGIYTSHFMNNFGCDSVAILQLTINNTDDNNACTIDACDTTTGIAMHTPIFTDDGNPCTLDACDPLTGIISHSTISTDDGNACTIDGCDLITGVYHIPVITDDNDACTTDACDTATGYISHIYLNTDDNNACTLDACDPVTGIISHTPVNINDNNECTIDACNTVTGNITHVQVNTNDNNACTVDACDPLTGNITHILINTNDNNVCTTDACNTLTGNISHVAINSDDGNACTIDGCDPISGVFHNPVDVNDNNVCTTDACDPVSGISHIMINTNDGNACTIDGCYPVTGLYHTAISINDNNGCTLDACNSSTGIISHTPVNVNDNNVCTTDGCDSLTGIISHIPVNTDDNNACTSDGCDPITGVFHTPLNTSDNNACTIDVCDPSLGVFHIPVNTDDNNPCTIDGCDPITGVFHNPAVEICGNGIDDDCDGLIDEDCYVTLQLKLFIEGFYLGDSMMIATVDPVLYPTLCDTISVELRDVTYPYNVIYHDTSEINISGFGNFTFPYGVLGHSYYLTIRHRNAIETWSASPVFFNDTLVNYSFSNAKSKAYGNNQSDMGDGNFALFSGDISDAATGTIGRQDGVVESQDYSDMENAIFLTLLGYIPEDLTGDGIVESSDYVLMENNVYYTIFAMRP